MKKIFIFMLGLILIIIGFMMKSAIKTIIVPGNQTETTLVGAGVGAGVGAATGAAIGGIGVVACGTGVGIPVGAVCLALAAICGTAGGAVGYTSGTPDTSITELIYSPMLAYIVIGIGLLLMIISIYTKKKENNISDCTKNSEENMKQIGEDYEYKQ